VRDAGADWRAVSPPSREAQPSRARVSDSAHHANAELADALDVAEEIDDLISA
jgi:hypothetical protein